MYNHFDIEEIVNINPENDDVKVVARDSRKLLQNVCGHNSFFLRKPVIEGKFYLELKGFQPETIHPRLKITPNFRVGVVPSEYYYNYPLGQGFSIAYKSDGSLISHSKKIAQFTPYTFEDTIGVGLCIEQVFKHRNKERLAPRNSVIFFKNGKPVCENLSMLTQDLYSFAGSLFNGAMIEVAFEGKSLKHLPVGFRAYGEHLGQKILYKDNELKGYELQ